MPHKPGSRVSAESVAAGIARMVSDSELRRKVAAFLDDGGPELLPAEMIRWNLFIEKIIQKHRG
jgi:hypothetical protein